MRIYNFEDDNDLQVLRAENKIVAKDEDLRATVDQMQQLMHDHKGIGLAAPQVGINKRFFIVEVQKGEKMVFINPILLFTSVETVVAEEGCLSLAGLYSQVERPASIKMQATDLEGRRFTVEAEGLMAVCLQHEFDHLNGKLFIDHLKDEQLEKTLKQYDKIARRKKR